MSTSAPSGQETGQTAYVLTYETNSDLFEMENRHGILAVYDTHERALENAKRYINEELERHLDDHDPPLKTEKARERARKDWSVNEGDWKFSLSRHDQTLELLIEGCDMLH